MLRAACYERVSTDEQALHGGSIDAQKNLLIEYCEKNSIKIVDHYTDEGVSAGKPVKKRPELVRLLSDVEAGKIDIILFTKLDRWFRNTPEYYKTQEILDRCHCDWKTILEEYDTSTSNGRLVIGIMLNIAQSERERTGERIKVVFENKWKNHEYTGMREKPFGYKAVIQDGKRILIKDPDHQEAYEAFFDTLIKTHSNTKARAVAAEYGLYLKLDQITDLLQSAKFITGTYNGVKDFCPAYITQEQLDDIKRRRVKGTRSDRVYLFTGLVKCPVCGRTMKSAYNIKQYKGKHIYNTYRCYYTRNDQTCTNKTHISEMKMERQLLNLLDQKMTAHIAEIEAHNREQKKKQPTVSIPSLKEKLRRLNTMYMDGNIDDREYKEKTEEIKKRIRDAESQKVQEIDPEPLRQFVNSNYRETYATLTRDEKQRFWREIVETIIMNGHDVADVVLKNPC